MSTNSHFYGHGVDHLSASTINQFNIDPCIWLLRLLGKKSTVGPAAWRGTAVDRIAFKAAQERPASEEDLLWDALQEFDRQVHFGRTVDSSEEKIKSERADIAKYVANCYAFYQSLGESPDREQGKIEIMIGDIEVPFIGYYDLLYKDSVRDCKTAGRMVSNLSNAHARQGAIYGAATGRPAFIDYIGKRGTASFEVLNPSIYIDQVYRIAKAMEIALSRSSDLMECCQAFYPNFDHWIWDAESVRMAKGIWQTNESTIKIRNV